MRTLERRGLPPPFKNPGIALESNRDETGYGELAACGPADSGPGGRDFGIMIWREIWKTHRAMRKN